MNKKIIALPLSILLTLGLMGTASAPVPLILR